VITSIGTESEDFFPFRWKCEAHTHSRLAAAAAVDAVVVVVDAVKPW